MTLHEVGAGFWKTNGNRRHWALALPCGQLSWIRVFGVVRGFYIEPL